MFSNCVSKMERMTAHKFEDILQVYGDSKVASHDPK